MRESEREEEGDQERVRVRGKINGARERRKNSEKSGRRKENKEKKRRKHGGGLGEGGRTRIRVRRLHVQRWLLRLPVTILRHGLRADGWLDRRVSGATLRSGYQACMGLVAGNLLCCQQRQRQCDARMIDTKQENAKISSELS